MFVTGCHRSGTSLLASLIHGLVTGQDPRQRSGDLELKLENPLGFFESERLVEINDILLKAIGCQWDRPIPLATYGFKEDVIYLHQTLTLEETKWILQLEFKISTALSRILTRYQTMNQGRQKRRTRAVTTGDKHLSDLAQARPA